ncbi:MAG: hypothetical protein R2847_08980 [Bacteroidia bacterium]
MRFWCSLRFDIAFAAEDRIANHNVTAYGMVEDTEVARLCIQHFANSDGE